jgi:two-component system OmpR family response regulator
MTRILIADDDAAIRDIIRFALERVGFATVEAATGRATLACFAETKPDLIVLDIMMPDLDGLDVCREIRRGSATPILFLSSRDEEVDRVLGLELGADDYLAKPFSPRELVARVKAVLRRGAPPSVLPEGTLRYGKLRLEPDFAQAFWDGRLVSLTATELGILRTLMARPGMIFSRDRLMDGAYTIAKTVSDRTIDSHVRRVRAKFAAISASPIETVHGLGYKLSACD